ncbi:hypothetical protein PHMEG_0004295 [Phytophthora megakarya]|uniref:Uncharacterized protein n=1 Tax=Phytophthora megakarya TaxID=4795 RepID=A0A225WVQ8_9STRA|nr:hypothetical protein PHMEG_0004295 [Phytophthora megakarya]
MADDDFRLHFRMPRLYFHAVCREIARSPDFLSVGGHTSESLLAKRLVGALMGLRSDVICWPELRDRREIAERIKQVSKLPNCIDLIDGIELLL